MPSVIDLHGWCYHAHHLTIKDCFPRRRSPTRYLASVPFDGELWGTRLRVTPHVLPQRLLCHCVVGSTLNDESSFSHVTNRFFFLQDEDGEFRPAYNKANQALPFSPPFAHPDAASEKNLQAFRDFLCQSHPHLATEFQNNALLKLSDKMYTDTESRHTLLRAHRQIMRLRQMDHFLMNAQRQGRISFYMTCTGEEGIHMGAASALDPNDPILAQYREQGLLMWRGFSLEQFTNQCFSNDRDVGRGRQMPVHYGSKALQYHTVSSPLGTQLPQAVGVAYRLKLAKQPNVPVCFFGDGAASTTDFHSAMNFAATLKAPVLFFCRNNGYAISTPVTDQYAGDGIVSRAPGYGMAGIRVDGNDIFAVHAAVREARSYALKKQAPVLIEAMTYRLGHHSTSDDSTRYRSADEVEDYKSHMDPLARLEKFLIKHGLLTPEAVARVEEDERFAVRKAMQEAEKRPKPPLDLLFEDVYHELPASLESQKKALKEHIAKYPQKYSH